MNQIGGYFLLPRSELKNIKKPFSKFEAWLFLVSEAAYESQNIVVRDEVYCLDPGDVVRSYRSLSREWGWSVNKVRRFVFSLISEGKLAKKTNTETNTHTNTHTEQKTAHLTVCKYGSYRGVRNSDVQKTNTHTNTETNTVGIKGIKKIKKGDFLNFKYSAENKRHDY